MRGEIYVDVEDKLSVQHDNRTVTLVINGDLRVTLTEAMLFDNMYAVEGLRNYLEAIREEIEIQ